MSDSATRDPSEFPLELSVVDARNLLTNPAKNATLIDVREPWELEICRIDGSEAIPMRQIPEQLALLPKDRHLLILCHHGSRSRNVTEFLRSRGFAAVSNVTGGIAAWADTIDPSLARY
jgi:adenylyltransferase/sulfurtransferase